MSNEQNTKQILEQEMVEYIANDILTTLEAKSKSSLRGFFIRACKRMLFRDEITEFLDIK